MKKLKEFVSSMSFKKHSVLTNKYTILEGEKKGCIFYSRTVTPKKINEYNHGIGKTIYYFEGSIDYKNVDDCISAFSPLT